MRIKKRKKHTHCLNCGFVFDAEVNNYCPHCGQENDDKRKSLFWFIRDFIEDLVSVDNRLFRSIIPFLFKPGKLTQAYLAGQRRTYVSPIRLYLTFSIMYFFIFTYIIEKQVADDDVAFSVRTFGETMTKSEKKMEAQATKIDSLLQVVDSLTTQNLPDTLQKKDSQKIRKKRKKGGRSSMKIIGIPIDEVARLMAKPGMTEAAVLDSLGKENTLLNRFFVNRAAHIAELTPREFVHSYIQRIPMTMFFVLPLFATMLTVFYYRRYYVENLVFTLHIHSFWYFILALILAPIYRIQPFPYWIIPIGILLIFLYNYKAFRNVYKQSRILTLFKLFLLLIGYIVLISVASAVSLLLNFLLV